MSAIFCIPGAGPRTTCGQVLRRTFGRSRGGTRPMYAQFKRALVSVS